MLAPQPDPVGGEGSVVDDLVVDLLYRIGHPRVAELLQERRRQGVERYGSELRYRNGRDPDCDLIQELVDALMYAQQAERTGLVLDLESMINKLARQLEVRRG